MQEFVDFFDAIYGECVGYVDIVNRDPENYKSVSSEMSRSDRAVFDQLFRDPSWCCSKIYPFLAGYPGNGCWEWTRNRTSFGYGIVSVPNPGRPRTKAGVHRVLWLDQRGPISPGKVLDHDGPNGCHNRSCANPDHLTTATQRENSVVTSTGVTHEASLRKTCPKGHSLSEGNLVKSQQTRGFRSCLVCNRENSKETRELVRDAAKVLGLSRAEYVRRYSWNKGFAKEILCLPR